MTNEEAPGRAQVRDGEAQTGSGALRLAQTIDTERESS